MADLHLKKLILEDFKNFSGEHEFRMDQPPGLYFVQGRNLLHPELGANGVGKSTLFDALLWVLFNKTGRDNKPAAAITPWGGKKNATVSVSLEFVSRGRDLTLIRTRNPNHLILRRHDTEHDEEISQDDVPALLGMSEEMLRRTLVLGQFGTLFLDLRPEHQAQMFTEALSLDVWLEAVAAASTGEKASNAALRDLEVKEASNAAALQTTEDQIVAGKEKAESFEEDRARRLDDIAEDIEEQEGIVDDLQNNPVKKPEQPSRAAVAALEKEIAPIREKRAGLHAEYQRMLRDVQKAEDVLDAFEQGRDKTKAPRCPECNQVISKREEDEHRQKLKNAVDGLDADIKAKKKELDTCDDEGKKIKERLDEATDAYDKEHRAFGGLLSKYDEYNRKLNREITALSALKVEQAGIKGEQNIHKQLHADAIQKRTDLRARKLDLAQTRKHEEGKKAEAEFWVEAFREIRLSIIDATLIELEMAASRHMAMLGLDDWGIKFDTEREAKSGSVSYSFTVLLYPPGQRNPVKWESYSGGESQRIQLAVAFGLSETLLARAGLHPNIEVLDEPTRGLSPQGIEDLIEHLRDRALELRRAIFLVEHHSLDKGSFDGTLLITKDKKGSSIKWQ